MQRKKTFIQKHRLKAFTATLEQVEKALIKSLEFSTNYAEVYHFPKAITRNNTRRLKKWIKAAQQLKDLELKNIK